MYARLIFPIFFIYLAAVFLLAQGSVFETAEGSERYAVPYTEYGQPDLQGTWSVMSLTPMQSPAFFGDLTATQEEAQRYIAEVKGSYNDFVDPDTFIQDISRLDVIHGEIRTSAVTIPINGQIPFNENGSREAAADFDRFLNQYDHPEQRPLFERCLGSMGFPPMRPFVSDIPRKVVQTEDYFLLYTEDPGGVRIIPLKDEPTRNAAPSFAGSSFGYWVGDTLVIETTNFRGEYPGRLNLGSAVLVSAESSFIERFTRIENDQLLYQFTMTDPTLYSEPWSGEFSLQASPHETYEYSCHEGNYSLPGILLGGRRVQERDAAKLASE